MIVNDKLRLLEVLTRIGSEGPKVTDCGICTNVQVGLEDSRIGQDGWLFEACWAWPESKHPVYPVEGDVRGYSGALNHWDISTEYGARRYRLLAWLIHKLTKEIRAELSL